MASPTSFVGDSFQLGYFCPDFLNIPSLFGGKGSAAGPFTFGASPGVPTANVSIGPGLNIPGLPSLEILGITNIFGSLNVFALSEFLGVTQHIGAAINNGINIKNSVDNKNGINVGSGPTVFNGPTTLNGPTTINAALLVAGDAKFIGVSITALEFSKPALTVNAQNAALFNGNVNVNGIISATNLKTFNIPHPSKPNYRLIHACLEGPEAGVYYRGRLENDNKIVLPDYWQNLINPESITVNLTPRRHYQELYVKSIEWGKIINVVNNGGGSIDCDYIVYAERIDVDKLQVEVKE